MTYRGEDSFKTTFGGILSILLRITVFILVIYRIVQLAGEEDSSVAVLQKIRRSAANDEDDQVQDGLASLIKPFKQTGYKIAFGMQDLESGRSEEVNEQYGVFIAFD